MPLTLEQYADYLDTRTDLIWPAAPMVERPKARPHLIRLAGVRAVTWNVYGTLLNISTGALLFEHSDPFIMELALEKTIQEFKMWKAMSRKPGKPSEYMRIIYNDILSERRLATTGGERHPEVSSDKIWEAILKRLMKNEYLFDASFFGSLDDYARKVAYFFHASLQGTACYAGAADAMEHVHKTVGVQGLLADGQCFTPVQLARGLRSQKEGCRLETLVAPELCVLSHEIKGRRPSDRLFGEMLERLQARGIEPAQVLHIGSDLNHDVQAARKWKMRSGLFAGDKASLQVDPKIWKEPECRPDVLLTELEQIAKVVG